MRRIGHACLRVRRWILACAAMTKSDAIPAHAGIPPRYLR